MPEPILIRPGVPEDAATIVDFNQRLAWETESKQLAGEVLRAGVDRLLSDPTLGTYFVACRGEEIVGQLMITYEWSDWRNGHLWWIQSVYVRSDCRGLHVFRQLYEHVRGLAHQQAVGLRLYVERHNEVARRVYHHVGMQDSGYLVLEELFPAALNNQTHHTESEP